MSIRCLPASTPSSLTRSLSLLLAPGSGRGHSQGFRGAGRQKNGTTKPHCSTVGTSHTSSHHLTGLALIIGRSAVLGRRPPSPSPRQLCFLSALPSTQKYLHTSQEPSGNGCAAPRCARGLSGTPLSPSRPLIVWPPLLDLSVQDCFESPHYSLKHHGHCCCCGRLEHLISPGRNREGRGWLFVSWTERGCAVTAPSSLPP